MNKARHIAIIMDGNGRWAELKGKKRADGHEAGAKIVREITEFCSKNDDIESLTLYAFSTENWKRPRLEVEYLMKLLKKYLETELENYLQNNIRFEAIGDIRAFSKSLQQTIKNTQEKTAHCDGLVQSLALNYGAQDEILRAVNRIKNHENDITEAMLKNALDCKHDVDLIIRTGGDHRLSNFLLWQAAYAELFFTDTLWPDFTTNELEKIIKDFTKIERRFGGLK
ncbi:MAG: di-trans,poly-cis-decaprenylcistransferase [Sulfurimonas sp.]|jgi:undecaprenyl diphosphate synthase|uniref:di-trans,poly-cis-decaprenylcistransferase n=1 Tax=unclassified Sulfurimonas TaxID=2623549 RepID=UPI0008CE73D5|nr:MULTISPECIES: di-trans,poly-cis-decaprenylcistransferase [unclassified Sulfurimonas]OHE20821.1 MAG: di-trans,poly-cis-decaprenylcistransferase [Sulfurimonas sp. RIFOXYD2_FULL_37_8]MBS4068412.1 di-trans,poly-cis-decaprenylcistransferase [Sulfurimonas sp.]MDD3855943.1 di-trans,poly-cis-decaprenylcistransferase [Sulfurimonas sp.]MDP2893096.1 di-trans,poly-cis-decaprenylcistransferase [Sulfurimonas sp.]OHE05524.1 MAG: di-trans,poly-cis-decaprenylcistransferase [Sulfurimonas sp. RIFOXYB12_FULL_3